MKLEGRQQRYVIAYDLSCDRERARVDKLLKGWGHRVQKSVFLLTLPRSGLARLTASLEALNLKTGSVLILRLQAGTPLRSVGKPFQDPDAALAYIL
jgi:CRISPR-associated protein Cas2